MWVVCGSMVDLWYANFLAYLAKFNIEGFYGWPVSALQSALANVLVLTAIN